MTSEHTWGEVLMPYVFMAGVAAAGMAYLVWYNSFYKPTPEVTVKEVRKSKIMGRSGGYV